MYSEHGLDAVIRPVSGLVCQSLIVSSYWMPGSAHSHAALEILPHSSRASTVSMTSPVPRARSPNSVSPSTARMNSSVTRTELLAFWYCTEWMSAPPRSMSKPASRSARILSSSRALVSTNSTMSGWSTSSTTILAARRVAPPDLIVPADASAPRMNDTGPDAVPPEDSSSLDDRMRDRLRPAPDPPLKMKPSSLYQFRIESIESSTDRMKHAETCCGDCGADVEPDRGVEREHLVQTACRSARGRTPRRPRAWRSSPRPHHSCGRSGPRGRSAGAGSTRARRCRPRRGSTSS